MRQRLLIALDKSEEELRFMACVVGHEHIDGIKGYGYVRAADKLKELKASSQAKTAIEWLGS
jgi:5'-3' exonuclease